MESNHKKKIVSNWAGLIILIVNRSLSHPFTFSAGSIDYPPGPEVLRLFLHHMLILVRPKRGPENLKPLRCAGSGSVFFEMLGVLT
jgi:hypothetical protein